MFVRTTVVVDIWRFVCDEVHSAVMVSTSWWDSQRASGGVIWMLLPRAFRGVFQIRSNPVWPCRNNQDVRKVTVRCFHHHSRSTHAKKYLRGTSTAAVCVLHSKTFFLPVDVQHRQCIGVAGVCRLCAYHSPAQWHDMALYYWCLIPGTTYQ